MSDMSAKAYHISRVFDIESAGKSASSSKQTFAAMIVSQALAVRLHDRAAVKHEARQLTRRPLAPR
jgi:hypothetical protein